MKVSTSLIFSLLSSVALAQIQIGQNINGDSQFDRLGTSVAISADGNVIAIGAPSDDEGVFDNGSVKIYTNNEGNWVQLGNTIIGEAEFDGSGFAIELSSNGNAIAISSSGNDLGNSSQNRGEIRIFQLQGNTWEKIGDDIYGDVSFTIFGRDLALSDDGLILATSAPEDDTNGNNTGLVKVYQFQNNDWVQKGSTIFGQANFERLGRSVSLSSDGNILAVGITANNTFGKTEIYQFENNDWIKLGNTILSEAELDAAGESVSLSSDGTILAIGAPGNSGNGTNAGHVRVYEFQNNIWQQLGTDIDGEAQGDGAGFSVSLSGTGDTVVVGSYRNDSNGIDSGHVRIFKFQNNDWLQVGNTLNGDAEGDEFGFDIALSQNGSTLIIGAPRNSEINSNAGQAKVFDLSEEGLSLDSIETLEFRLYPNPATNFVKVEMEDISRLNSMTLYNFLGQPVLTSTTAELDISKLEKGPYIVEIITGKGIITRKLIKK